MTPFSLYALLLFAPARHGRNGRPVARSNKNTGIRRHVIVPRMGPTTNTPTSTMLAVKSSRSKRTGQDSLSSSSISSSVPHNNSCRHFFAALNDHVNQRVDQADDIGTISYDPADVPYYEDDSSTDDNSFDTASTTTTKDAILQAFFQQFARVGGFGIVKLSDEDSRVISATWDLTQRIFVPRDNDGKASLEQGSLDLRHQSLVRSSSEAAEKSVGYQYFEIGHMDDSLSVLETQFGKVAASTAFHSLDAIRRVGTQLAAAVAARAVPTEIKKAQSVVQDMVGNSSDGSSPSFQRLARYMEASTEKDETENLRSHCDWSILTLIPVSEVPGLQVFNVHSQTWVAVEAVAKQLATETIVGQNHTLPRNWNSSYMVVMTGKWLELLTNGTVKSTIHRVVSPRATPQRYSAPFFLRMRLSLLQAVEALTLTNPQNIIDCTETISQFLNQNHEISLSPSLRSEKKSSFQSGVVPRPPFRSSSTRLWGSKRDNDPDDGSDPTLLISITNAIVDALTRETIASLPGIVLLILILIPIGTSLLQTLVTYALFTGLAVLGRTLNQDQSEEDSKQLKEEGSSHETQLSTSFTDTFAAVFAAAAGFVLTPAPSTGSEMIFSSLGATVGLSLLAIAVLVLLQTSSSTQTSRDDGESINGEVNGLNDELLSMWDEEMKLREKQRQNRLGKDNEE